MASPSAAKTAQRVLSVDEALERILARIAALAPETIALGDALGCVLAEDVVADRDVPPFRNSAMDGYAVRGEDVARPSVRLRVVGAVGAGETPARAVGRGEAMRIMTGAPLPDGADTVVRVEDTDGGKEAVTITRETPTGLSVRQAGEDLRRRGGDQRRRLRGRPRLREARRGADGFDGLLVHRDPARPPAGLRHPAHRRRDTIRTHLRPAGQPRVRAPHLRALRASRAAEDGGAREAPPPARPRATARRRREARRAPALRAGRLRPRRRHRPVDRPAGPGHPSLA